MTQVPVFQITSNDLLLIGDILKPYADLVRKLSPESEDKQRTLRAAADLQERIGKLNTIPPGKHVHFVLTVNDLQVMMAALELFIAMLPRVQVERSVKERTLISAQLLYANLRSAFKR